MPEKTCYIIGGGELFAPISEYKKFLNNRNPLIAADKGGEYLWRMKIYPDYLVGDFDSISREARDALEKAGVSTIVFPQAKDETDLEIAADLAVEKGFKKIFILCAWGGRPDQSLAGISVIHKIKKEKGHGIILNPRNSLELISSEAFLEKSIGENFSLIPWAGEVSGLYINGCKFDVENANLKPWETLGISNKVMEKKAEIRLEKGLALLVRNLEIPFHLGNNSNR